ncbi:MAG TPA: xanthine dehydrogenase family protein subunit M [Bryobacteraceae bacterium]|nr:xanthine dehydrogenase family protein subunit M [Bryobacteraceae bacterium]
MRSVVGDYNLVVSDTLHSALTMLGNGEGWRPIAGGTDLMVLLNAGTLPFRRLVSLRKLDDLRQIVVTETSVSIGAAVTYTEIQGHAVLRSEFPLLCQAASWTGSVANQNQGTLGGNIVNASPAADSLPPLLVHDAQIHLLSMSGSRSVPYAQFHLGYKLIAMRPDELLHSIELPRRAEKWRYHGRKVGTRRAQAISKVAIAAAARVEDRRIRDVRLAFASIAPIPLRCIETELAIIQLARDARQTLASEIAPISDIRSTAEYRSRVAQNLLAEFLETLP